MGVALIALVALFALPMLAAGAQEGGPPPSPGQCTFNATGTAPGPVTGSVTVPAGATEVTVTFTGGNPSTQTFSPVPAGGGTFNFTFAAPTTPGVVTANYVYGNKNAYSTGCQGPNGEAEIAIEAANAARPAAQAQQLAFTGSSDTPSFVLIGIAALVVGAVLVIAARRHKQVS
jgi:LPXTG-motif cell wall-anchored protein